MAQMPILGAKYHQILNMAVAAKKWLRKVIQMRNQLELGAVNYNSSKLVVSIIIQASNMITCIAQNLIISTLICVKELRLMCLIRGLLANN
jgi:hypothetical protein